MVCELFRLENLFSTMLEFCIILFKSPQEIICFPYPLTTILIGDLTFSWPPPSPKKACIVFFDEVDAIGGARFDEGLGGKNEFQCTLLETVKQLDGFDVQGNIRVLMATNR